MTNRKVEVIRSSRKTMSIQIRPDGTVLVRAPVRLSQREIAAFLEEKSDWIEEHTAKVLEAKEAGEQDPLRPEDIRTLADQALRDIPSRVQFYAARMGVTYRRITIRNQRGRWGSCSGQGNLNFNCLLMLAPPEVRDYVVVHELAHRKQMNHSSAFWEEVEQILPDYRERRRWLKDNGGKLLARMQSGENEQTDDDGCDGE